MGYDMYWVHTPEKLQKQLTELSTEIHDLYHSELTDTSAENDATRAATRTALIERRDELSINYFRLNIWGMSRARNLLYEYGMAYDSDSDHFSEDGVVVDPRTSPLATAGVQDGVPGIAIHKLCSNDGWIVTPEECLGALAQWRIYCKEHGLDLRHAPETPDDGPVDWWQDFLAFLASSAEHGGFAVY
jgi:leucyl-tRNA synthetase